jgi:hypothetical protein
MKMASTPGPRALVAALALGVAAMPTPVFAQQGRPAVAPGKPLYSRYEQDSIRAAVAKVKATVDPSPQGKVIEDIEIVTLDVFEPRDFIPEFVRGLVNWFHVTSRPYTIEREVLMPKGSRYDQARVDETARNLRALRQLSLVLCVPIHGSAPDRVKLLVITKDVWSLRLNSDYRIAGGRLEYLLLQPSEENFFGTHQSLSAIFSLDPGRYSFGGRYTIPRLAGSRIRAVVDGNVLISRAEGRPEGSYGSFTYGQPLYSTEAKWAWGAQVSWRYEITRRNVGGQLSSFDAEATPFEDNIPYQYRSDLLSGNYEVTRSFGSRDKYDLALGVSASRKVYRTGDLSAFDPAAQAEFISTAIPVSDTQVGPYVELHARSTRYVTVLDLNTLGLQEDFLIGHDAYLRLIPVTTALNSSRNFLGVYAAAAYTVPFGDGVARAFIESTTEIAADSLPDASIEVGGRIATPRTPIGRLHFDARMLHRYRNYLNTRSVLGGDTRLRGYPTRSFIGKDLIAATLEFRSRAVQILGCQLGGAAFFDAGDAFDGFADLRLKQSAGFGVRILFPQLDRVVVRADWGFPLTRGVVPPSSFPGDIVVTFRQAFPMPVLPVTD